MRPGQNPRLETGDTIDVSPLYLAGREHTNRVFDRLVGQWTWGHSSSTDLGQQFAWSADHRFRLGAGQLDPGASWHIAAAKDPLGPPQWQAGFSQETPPEIIMAVTDELARPGSSIDWTGETHPALKSPTGRHTAIRTLSDAGWHSVYRNGVLDLEAPDELIRVEIRIDPPGDPLDLMSRPHIYVEAGPRGNGGYAPYWQAMFTTAAPAAVLDVFTRSLTDPTPVMRQRDWMDEDLLAHLDTTDTHGRDGDEAPNEDLAAIAVARPVSTTTTAQRLAAAATRTTIASRSLPSAGEQDAPRPGPTRDSGARPGL
ncbi:DUF317 domain-containing protein [Kitasatospora purpeofusca]|uniref:DUF317 domain-containing protein n=1 Tax=Kitasatospora purpeofusca TaxID=67352 RepID=UPI0035E1CDF3